MLNNKSKAFWDDIFPILWKSDHGNESPFNNILDFFFRILDQHMLGKKWMFNFFICCLLIVVANIKLNRFVLIAFLVLHHCLNERFCSVESSHRRLNIIKEILKEYLKDEQIISRLIISVFISRRHFSNFNMTSFLLALERLISRSIVFFFWYSNISVITSRTSVTLVVRLWFLNHFDQLMKNEHISL